MNMGDLAACESEMGIGTGSGTGTVVTCLVFSVGVVGFWKRCVMSVCTAGIISHPLSCTEGATVEGLLLPLPSDAFGGAGGCMFSMD